MKLNDLVKIKDNDSDKMERTTGIVLKLDWHHPDSSDSRMRIAEVLWDTGPEWIDASRIELVDRELSMDQLENVIGGMSSERFEMWKVNAINNG